MTPAVNFPLFHGTRGLGGGSWQGFDLSECEEPGGPILEVFSQERAPTGALTTNNCAHKCGPRLWGVSATEGLPQTHPAPSAAVCGPPGRSKEPGAETAPPAKMPEPQPPPPRPPASPETEDLPPESDQKPAGACRGGRGPRLAGNRIGAPQQSTCSGQSRTPSLLGGCGRG